jgi:hypothetical protein
MSTIKAANLQNTGSGDPVFKNSSGTETGQLINAWALCQSDGTIDDSFNVSSVTDTGTGRYRVTWTNTQANTNYAVVATVKFVSSGNTFFCSVVENSTTTCLVRVCNDGGSDSATPFCLIMKN